jgi:hypothetical protein
VNNCSIPLTQAETKKYRSFCETLFYSIQAEKGFATGAVLFDLGGNGAFWQKKGVTLHGLWILEKK